MKLEFWIWSILNNDSLGQVKTGQSKVSELKQCPSLVQWKSWIRGWDSLYVSGLLHLWILFDSCHDFAKHLAKKVGQGSLRYTKKKTKASACNQPEISMFKLLSHISNHHFIHPVEATPFNTTVFSHLEFDGRDLTVMLRKNTEKHCKQKKTKN